MTLKIRTNWSFASKWILDVIDGNFYNHIKSTNSMHISVPY